jgi:hypothetical protein
LETGASNRCEISNSQLPLCSMAAVGRFAACVERKTAWPEAGGGCRTASADRRQMADKVRLADRVLFMDLSPGF